MADTLYTSDGKVHVLLGSTTLSGLVREYMGDEAADAVAELEKNDAYERARVDSEMDAYRESLEHWRQQAAEWAEMIDSVLQGADDQPQQFSCAELLDVLRDLSDSISCEI